MSAEPAATAPQSSGAPARRARLELRGLTRDGTALRLADADGIEFTLDLDARLREVLERPGTTPATTTGGTTMDSTLRPRDIQARIRSGESPEEVAAAGRTTVDKIMAYAGPVLAEREHVAGRAQKSSVRRRAAEAGGAGAGAGRTLGEAVTAHLRSVRVDPGSVAWDSWRRDDGRWVLTAAFAGPDRSGTAELTFDLPGNFVVPENDDARWLVGDLPDTPLTPQSAGSPVAADDLGRARERRRTSVPPVGADGPASAGLGEQLSIDDELGADAVELVSEAGPTETTLDLTAQLDQDADGADPASDPESGPDQPEAPRRRPVRKRGGRASVPTWDEIMFGGGDQDEHS